jgi:hypothetical protein
MMKEGEMRRIILMMAVLGSFLFAPMAQADWAPAKRLTWTSGISNNAAVAVGPGGNVYVVWSDATPGNVEVYYKKGKQWARKTNSSLKTGRPFVSIWRAE